MTDVYRKWGRVVRYENGVTIHVEEAGEASETDGVFLARPAQTRVSVPHTSEVSILDGAGPTVETFVAQTLLSVRRSRVERLIVSAGIAQHETNGVTWTEESRRVHVALVNPPLRVLIDLASFDRTIIETVAAALARAGDERAAPSRIRLAPNVSAALLPALAGELAMEQTGGGFDGKGQPIETRAVTSDPPPNWYRPGYAVRPVRAWLNIRALPFGRIDSSAPAAVALLAPVDGTTLRVLCIDGDEVYPTTVDATRIGAVSRSEPAWYPHAAGSFGVEMML
ncbi:MAG TPA: hypothetical protein VF713_05345 [Thermoanaerobaculia bacterium]